MSETHAVIIDFGTGKVRVDLFDGQLNRLRHETSKNIDIFSQHGEIKIKEFEWQLRFIQTQLDEIKRLHPHAFVQFVGSQIFRDQGEFQQAQLQKMALERTGVPLEILTPDQELFYYCVGLRLYNPNASGAILHVGNGSIDFGVLSLDGSLGHFVSQPFGVAKASKKLPKNIAQFFDIGTIKESRLYICGSALLSVVNDLSPRLNISWSPNTNTLDAGRDVAFRLKDRTDKQDQKYALSVLDAFIKSMSGVKNCIFFKAGMREGLAAELIYKNTGAYPSPAGIFRAQGQLPFLNPQQ